MISRFLIISLFCFLLIPQQSFAIWTMVQEFTIAYPSGYYIGSPVTEFSEYTGPTQIRIRRYTGTNSLNWHLQNITHVGKFRIQFKPGSTGAKGTTQCSFYVMADLPCTGPPVPSQPRYDSNGDCVDNGRDNDTCEAAVVKTSLSACCSNGIKDGLEFAIDQGGACAGLPKTCPYGGSITLIDGVETCAVTRAESTKSQCEANGQYWSTTGQGCFFVVGGPVYANPESESPSGTELDAALKTNQILSDQINRDAINTAKITEAINANTNVNNSMAASIVSAITSGNSAIVAAINNKEITVPAPVVNVSAPNVNVNVEPTDVSSVVSAVNTTSGKLDQTLGKMDTQTGIFNGVKATLDQHLSTAQAARDEAAAASGQAIIRADSTNAKLDQTNGKLDQTNGKLDGIKTAVDGVKAAIESSGPSGPGGPGADMSGIEGRLDGVSGKLDDIKEGLSGSPSWSDPGNSPGSISEGLALHTQAIKDRYALMVSRVEAAPVFAPLNALSGVGAGGGDATIQLDFGSYGDASLDYTPFAATLGGLGICLHAGMALVAMRIIFGGKG